MALMPWEIDAGKVRSTTSSGTSSTGSSYTAGQQADAARLTALAERWAPKTTTRSTTTVRSAPAPSLAPAPAPTPAPVADAAPAAGSSAPDPVQDMVAKLTAAQLRELLNGRRGASTMFNRLKLEAESGRDRSLAGLQRKMQLASQMFSRRRRDGMRELGGRGLASQPMFAGRFLNELRTDEMNQVGGLQADMARERAAAAAQIQNARQDRDRMLADLAALEAAYRGGDADALLGNAGGF